MTWLELSVDVDPEAVEPVSELLTQYGYNGGVVVDQPIIPGDDGAEYVYDIGRPVTLRTYVQLDERVEEIRKRVEHALWHLGQIRPVGPLRVRQLEEQDWAEAWKQHYTIQPVGERTVIVPSWLEYDQRPDEIVLRLDPGMAFGTGLHPTTQLCLTLLETHLRPSMTVLDLGCGSGILAIAAAKLGAGTVLALDTDPIAVEATRENVARNDVAGVVQVAEGSLGGGARLGHWLYPTDHRPPTTDHRLPEGRGGEGERGREGNLQSPISNLHPPSSAGPACDLIVANIIARVLAALAQDLADALQPGGTLISSGIIAEREAEVAVAYAAADLTQIARRQEGDWVALVHQK